MDYDPADFPSGAPPGQEIIYTNADGVVSGSPTFDIYYEAVCALLFWVLFCAHGGLGLSHYLKGTWRGLLRWPLYLMMLGYVVATCISESLAWGYSVAARNQHASDAVYLAYLFFWHASSATFLVLLLALSSGYCITRNELRGHERVWLIPAIVFIAGVASDFTFVYVVSSQELSAAADRYQFAKMTPFESTVWLVGSLANIMCFILAWIFVFDSTQLEIKALDDEQEALHRAAHPTAEDIPPGRGRRIDDDSDEVDEDDDALVNPTQPNGGRSPRHPSSHAARGLGRYSQREGLLAGHPASSHAGNGARDVEQPASPVNETVADHVQYTVKKTLLLRFYFGVCAYLLASMLVIILPAFFNYQVQNVIIVLQFVVKYVFTLMLAWIFRPARDSPYLQIGGSDKDADDLGVSGLDTELAVTEYPGARPTPATTAPSAASTTAAAAAAAAAAGAAAGNGVRGTGGIAPALPVSLPPGATAAPAGVGAGATGLPPTAPPRRPRGSYSSLTGAANAAADSNGQKGKPKFTLDDAED